MLKRLFVAAALSVATLGLSTTVAVTQASADVYPWPPPPPASATVCPKPVPLLTGCQTFAGDQYSDVEIPDLLGTTLGNDTASSLHVASGYLTLYRDVNFQGTCEQFTGDVTALLGSIIEDNQASSLRVTRLSSGCAPRVLARVCSANNFAPVCQNLDHDIPDLRGTAVGNDTISSVVPSNGLYLVLYSDINYSGQCQEFNGPLGGLSQSVVGDNAASSLTIRTVPGTCHNPSTVTITSIQRVINHLQTTDREFGCPSDFPYQVGYSNNSSANVTSVHLEDHDTYLKIGFTNWNVTGDQVYGVKLYCSIYNP